MSQSDSTTSASVVQFRDIKPGYKASSDGRVFSCMTGGGRYSRIGTVWHEMKPGRHGGGYLYVKLGANDQRSVHRLILTAFVGDCPAGMECRHLNGNPADNRLQNLAWGSHQENAADSVRHGTDPVGERNPRAKLSVPLVVEIRSLWETGKFTKQELADRFSVTRPLIGQIVRNQIWKHI